MFRVQFRDANNRSRIVVDTMLLPFDPRLGKEVRIRRRPSDTRCDTYQVVDHLYEVVAQSPADSGVVVYVAKIDG